MLPLPLPLPVGREASQSVGAQLHVRYRPERTLLYQLSARGFIAIFEQQLSHSQWLVGEYYSMADSMLTPFLNHLEGIPVLDEQGPIIAAGSVCADYLQRVRARSSAWVLAES
ncbi:hypothetical protein ATY37_04125 [Vibrio cidicii]|uniref:Glutathione S-transferase C-terminal domain-containing protein n=1 Tax=Vibrio cidicii TaxID=1763883 RepID=A0A151KY64_9VIBR|nr:glutathione S-transferase C-terminal domain-containing protein [Vibrio cidicii]KYN88438.1 hypothetical protein ATY37_04125 [Vibrio cidicii]